ncbi:MAG: hypothetical protein IPH06_13000 [Alphaproteobacteria bacterium]|nr:hypothetical protein [Alphaproteobacteria bacterium]QQS56379.1 MAG: hypothetical protein IPN28_08755 [Alphaproteobacteria bacterium]
MATKTKKPSAKVPAFTRVKPVPDGSRTPAPLLIAKDTWLIPCSLLEEWDRADSPFAPLVKHTVLDGYALTYALLGGVDESNGQPYARLALSFRPEPAVRNLLLTAIGDVLRGHAHVEGEWPGFDAYRTKEGEQGPTGDPLIIERTLKKTPSNYSCTVTSKFFRIGFYYDFNKHVISRFKYQPLPDLKETDDGKRRPYRKRGELPDPDSAPDSEINRHDAKFQTRISKDASERVDAFLKASGLKKTDLTERALAEFIERHADEFGFDPEV